jgi:hypothetical protein
MPDTTPYVPPSVLVLTPVKDARSLLPIYTGLIRRLTYPHDRVSIAFLEGDSTDGSYQALQSLLTSLRAQFARVELFKRDFGFQVPAGLQRSDGEIQLERRTVLAKVRNHLLSRALRDEDWVLWLDVDVVSYPPDVIEQLLSTGKDIVHPHCVNARTGGTFDLNAWRDDGQNHMDDLRAEGDLVPLDAVGGTMLLVRADAHRDGLVFPPFLYGRRSPRVRSGHRFRPTGGVVDPRHGDYSGEIETEGFGILAWDMGYEVWGMPNLIIKHRDY